MEKKDYWDSRQTLLETLIQQTDDEAERDMFRIQYAEAKAQRQRFKISANTIYGCLTEMLSPLAFKPAAICTTGMSRELIKYAATQIGTKFGKLRYIDTDCFMIESANPPPADIINTMLHQSDSIFNGKTELYFKADKDYHRFYSSGCKSYIFTEHPIQINLHKPVSELLQNYEIHQKSLNMSKVAPELKKDIYTFVAILLEHGV